MSLIPPSPLVPRHCRDSWWSCNKNRSAKWLRAKAKCLMRYVDELAKGRRPLLVQQPGGKQCVGRDETELVAERVCAIKASLAPGLSFDRAQNDGSCVARAFEGTFQIGHGEIHVVRIW